MSRITIIDAGCGHGKTEYIIRYMNANGGKSFMYISPLRELFDRLDGKGEYAGRGTAHEFYTPDNRNWEGTKLRDIKDAMEAGVDIKSTHSLFLRFDQEAMEIARSRDYELVIDEDLNAVTVLSASDGKEDEDNTYFQDLKQPITKSDLDWLLLNGNIAIDETNFNTVVWVKDSRELPHRYRDVECLVRTGAVSLVNDCFIVWSFPVSVFDAFDNITILTYRYSSSILKAYLDFYGKKYEHKTIIQDANGYHLEDFSPELEKGPEYAELVNICDVPKLNAIGVKAPHTQKTSLSSTWYKNKDHKTQIEQLGKNFYNYLRHYANADRDKLMWTSFKMFKDKLQPHGYTYRTTKSDETATQKEETFVACNCRATERYAECTCLVYLISKHLHPGIKNFLSLRDIKINENEYALSELLQWMFRSAIRRKEKIDIYIPSERMRNLLKSWLCTD